MVGPKHGECEVQHNQGMQDEGRALYTMARQGTHCSGMGGLHLSRPTNVLVVTFTHCTSRVCTPPPHNAEQVPKASTRYWVLLSQGTTQGRVRNGRGSKGPQLGRSACTYAVYSHTVVNRIGGGGKTRNWCEQETGKKRGWFPRRAPAGCSLSKRDAENWGIRQPKGSDTGNCCVL
jgi:hypothetical protein